jgi:hypothetical protein
VSGFEFDKSEGFPDADWEHRVLMICLLGVYCAKRLLLYNEIYFRRALTAFGLGGLKRVQKDV